ncbi:MAG: CvpA family protein [Planctomycetota bacterium]
MSRRNRNLSGPWARRTMGAIALMLLIASAGCIEYEETISLSESGSGTIRVSMRIASHIASNTTRLGQYADLLKDEDSARRCLSERKLTLTSYAKSETGGMVSIDLAASFDNLNHIADISGGDSFIWQRVGTGNWEFRRGINTTALPLMLAEGEEQYADSIRIVCRAVLPMRVEKAAFEENTAWTRKEGNSVTWTLPGSHLKGLKTPLSVNALTVKPVITRSGPFFEILKWGLVALMVVSGYSCRLYGATGTVIAIFFGNAVALNTFEPLADLLGRQSGGFDPYADGVCYIVLFLVVTLTTQLALLSRLREWIAFHPNLDRLMSLFVGLLAGFLLSGVIMTFYFLLPFHEDFFAGKLKPEEAPASIVVFRRTANQLGGSNLFDPVGLFPHKYIGD